MGNINVTQADRDAAAEYMRLFPDLRLPEAFARHRHRTASEQPASGEVTPAPGFQSEVADWMLTCFGEEIAADRIERGDRFIEEALELAQTIPGFTVERARALVEYVFNRPVGERGQEVGGVGVTLAALCNTYGLNIREEWERELARVWTKVDAIRAKQATKPVGSALPIALSTTSEAPAQSGEGRSNGAGEVAQALLPVTPEARKAAADLLDEVSSLLGDDGIGQVADLMRAAHAHLLTPESDNADAS